MPRRSKPSWPGLIPPRPTRSWSLPSPRPSQGFEFGFARIDDDYWRDTRSVIRPDGTRLGELRPWMMAELAKEDGDVDALWRRLKETDLQVTEWRGTSAFVFGADRAGAADYVQIALGREIEWRAGPIVNPDYRPWGEEELLDPSWPRTDQLPDSDRLAGPAYRLLGRAGGAVVHVRSFLDRCDRVERGKREAKRPELERRVIREVGPGATRETPFLEAVPDYFGFVPRELRFFQDWEDSSARPQRVFAHWALDIRDYTHESEREVGFIPRPLRPPTRTSAHDARCLGPSADGPDRGGGPRDRLALRLVLPDDPTATGSIPMSAWRSRKA